jgi:hypothetical protein
MNILLLLAHSIEEHDQLKLLSEAGYDVFSIGGYINPGAPHDPKRPALPEVPYHPELQAVVDALGTPDNLDAAKRHIPDDILDWADVIICHHYEHTWLVPQWDRIKHKRVIWRTVGQSVDGNEAMMAPLRKDGLQIVRYSPKERNIPNFAGEDALIRFYKDPDEWQGWTGEWPGVINITQHLAQRDPYTNYGFWRDATAGLALPNGMDGPPPPFALPLGPGSEAIGGPGELTYDEMKAWLRRARVYLYTGTQPASYTLGLIEAMMTGIPVVSIGPSHMRIFPYGHLMFEGHELVEPALAKDDPTAAGAALRTLLNTEVAFASAFSNHQRQRAIDLFGKDRIKAEWKAFLG